MTEAGQDRGLANQITHPINPFRKMAPETPMPTRYATIITDDDGREVVSAIGEFESAPQARAGRFETVAAGVLIGMVKGGPVDAVGGFGFPLGSQGVNGRAVGIARAQLKALPDAAKPGQGESTPANAAASKPVRKRAKPARRKSRKAKAARPAKTAAEPTGVSPHG